MCSSLFFINIDVFVSMLYKEPGVVITIVKPLLWGFGASTIPFETWVTVTTFKLESAVNSLKAWIAFFVL